MTAPEVISKPSPVNLPDMNTDKLTAVITVPFIDESLGEMR